VTADDKTRETDEAVTEAADTETTTAEPTAEAPSAAEDAESDAETTDPVAERESVDSDSDDKAGINWPRVLAFGILPALALLLGAAAGFLKWQDSSVRDTDGVRIESMQLAKDATVRLLSYKPDTVEQDLGSARELLTGEFRDSYTQLINDVVIPGSKERQISAVATVPAAASVSAEPNKAVVLVFVNQTVVVGTDAPTGTTSSVQVTMDRVGDRWLISEFDPV
jgi:Mce-associated membrane protein